MPTSSEGDAIEKELAVILEKRGAQKKRRSRSGPARQQEALELVSKSSAVPMARDVYDSSRSIMRLADRVDPTADPDDEATAADQCLPPIPHDWALPHGSSIGDSMQTSDDFENERRSFENERPGPSGLQLSTDVIDQPRTPHPEPSPFADVPNSFQIWPGLPQYVPLDFKELREASFSRNNPHRSREGREKLS